MSSIDTMAVAQVVLNSTARVRHTPVHVACSLVAFEPTISYKSLTVKTSFFYRVGYFIIDPPTFLRTH